MPTVSAHLRRRLAVLVNDPESLEQLIALLEAEGGGGGGVPFGPGTLGAVTLSADDLAFQGGDYTTFVLNNGFTLTGVPGVPVVIRAQESVTINGTITVAVQITDLLRQEIGSTPAQFGQTAYSGGGGGGGGGGEPPDASEGAPGNDGYIGEFIGYSIGTPGLGGSGGGTEGQPGSPGQPGTVGEVTPGFLRSLALYPGGLAGNVNGGLPGAPAGSVFGGQGGSANIDGEGGETAGGAGGSNGVGGGAGGVILIIAPSITIGAGGILAAFGSGGGPGDPGGNGTDGAGPGLYGSGGGGGGPGGQGGGGGGVFLFYNSLVNGGTVQVQGGEGGAPGPGGVRGVGNGAQDGGDGAAGALGTAGSEGVFVSVALGG